MPYNADLDQQLFTKSYEMEEGKITVSVFSYNNGPKKIQIVREIKNTDGASKFTKLGRLTKEELEGIMPLLKEASENM